MLGGHECRGFNQPLSIYRALKTLGKKNRVIGSAPEVHRQRALRYHHPKIKMEIARRTAMIFRQIVADKNKTA